MERLADDRARLGKRLDEARDVPREARPNFAIATASSKPRWRFPDLWDDPEQARKVTGRAGRGDGDDLDLLSTWRSRLDDVETLFELGIEEATIRSRPRSEADHRRGTRPGSTSWSCAPCSRVSTTKAMPS